MVPVTPVADFTPVASAQCNYSLGAVIQLIGTPHLFIADAQGVLHWGGDTRGLANRAIDWSNRCTVPLDTLQARTRGDPWLSSGLPKIGDPIYLSKWEDTESQPRLLHIQSIPDVELFGINTANYGNFILERDTWEERYGFRVGNLRVGPLAAAKSFAWSSADQASYAQLLSNLENVESTALFRANQGGQNVREVLRQIADCERRGLNDFDTNRNAATALQMSQSCIDQINPSGPTGRVPTPPTGLRVIPQGASYVRIIWDDQSEATGFRIYGGEQGASLNTVVATVQAHVTTYDFPTRFPGTPYCFTVSAFNDRGDSGPTSPVCNTTALPPTAPINVRIGESGTGLRIDWTATSATQTGFRIVRNDQTVGSVGADVTTYLDFGWDPRVLNCYRVVAFNNQGEASSAQACPGSSQPGAPSAPVNLRVTPLLGGTGVRLDWTNTSTNEQGIRVLRGGQVIANLGPGTTSYVDPMPLLGPDCWHVVAYNAAGSAQSNEGCRPT
jgi:hypothetical protein